MTTVFYLILWSLLYLVAGLVVSRVANVITGNEDTLLAGMYVLFWPVMLIALLLYGLVFLFAFLADALGKLILK